MPTEQEIYNGEDESWELGVKDSRRRTRFERDRHGATQAFLREDVDVALSELRALARASGITITPRRSKLETARLVDLFVEEQSFSSERHDFRTKAAEVLQQIESMRDEDWQRDALVRELVERLRQLKSSILADYLLLKTLLPLDEDAGRNSHNPPLVLPDGVYEEREEPEDLLEVEFFERFVEHIKQAGFEYSSADLIAFHQSMKCSDFTILGGPTGTGKSSLPSLYHEALSGSSDTYAGRFLSVAVSPTWLQIEDVLGHVNSLDHTYVPSKTGLYRHLIAAHEEEAEFDFSSGLYFVLLDEMNLAQVEHYFSDILAHLGSRGHRLLSVFEPQAVDGRCSFRRWPQVRLGTNIRFIGTVNYDETTKKFSPRVLDRATEIHLRPMPSLRLGVVGSGERRRPKGGGSNGRTL